MSSKKSLLCRCDRGIYKVSQVGIVTNDPIMITLEKAFFADCINCKGSWLIDPSLPDGNLMLSTSQAAKDRISELRKNEWDSQFLAGHSATGARGATGD